MLIVAGSDSSGGAGLQADLKTISALGAYGMTAVTAVTVQNTRGVIETVPIPARVVARQMEACWEDIGCDAIKTGMLATAEIVEAVAATILKHGRTLLVVDPVMIAKGGSCLLDPPGVAALKENLFPLATVVTPNLPEAGVLVGREISSREHMREAARAIHDLGPRNVVIKGGHLEGAAVDVFFDGREYLECGADRIPTQNSHGTGCIFASALASELARGKTARESFASAKQFVTAAIRGGLPLGGGQGPANPMFSRNFG